MRRRIFGGVIVALVGFALCVQADQLTGSQIFERAWSRWEGVGNPPFVRYATACDLVRGCETPDMRITMRTRDGLLYFETVPTTPGVAPRVLVRGGRLTVGGMDLGFFRSLHSRRVAPATVGVDADAAGAPTIASVTSVASAYDVALDGELDVDSRRTYELTLRPIRDPENFALRHVAVDVATGEIRSLTYAPTARKGETGFITYDFAPIAGTQRWWIVHIVWHTSIRVLFVPLVSDGSYDLRNITFPESVPDSDFIPR